MDLFGLIVELFTNADHFLVSIATDYGTLIYIAMFVIFFLETGIVVMSFLPGDSLLFVAGTRHSQPMAHHAGSDFGGNLREFPRLCDWQMARQPNL